MAKMRVHELAKELNIKSQDIIELLSTTDYAVKSASSGIEDAAQAAVSYTHLDVYKRQVIVYAK